MFAEYFPGMNYSVISKHTFTCMSETVINAEGLGALLLYFLFYCCKQEQGKQAAKLLWNNNLFKAQSNYLRLGRGQKRSLFFGFQKTHPNTWNNQLKILILFLTGSPRVISCLGHAPGSCVAGKGRLSQIYMPMKTLQISLAWNRLAAYASVSLKNPLWCKEGGREGEWHILFSTYYHKGLLHCTENFLAAEIPLAQIK